MKAALIIIVAIAVVIAVVIFKNKSETITGSSTPTVNQSINATPTRSTTPSVTSTAKPTTSAKTNPITKKQTVTITFANGTASPRSVNIRVGDTVKFVNNDNILRWPASGVHPTHQICPGFDSLRGLNKGESYSFTFREAKVCPWHDHLQPSVNGQITVE